jgi:prolyl-tRNA synthetase
VARRDILTKEIISKDGIALYIKNLLQQIQIDLFQKALDYREAHINEVNSFEEFKDVLERKGGFVSAHWDGTANTEEEIKNLTKATIRCIPLNGVKEAGSCILTGKHSNERVLFARAY